MLDTKTKRKPNQSSHWRYAGIVIGLAATTWLFYPFWYEPNGVMGLGFILSWLLSMLWIPFTIYRAQEQKLQWWNWILIVGCMTSHALSIFAFLGNYCCCIYLGMF
jgi:hypothetical protein